MRYRAFVLLLLAACGGREERAPVSRPSPGVAAVVVVDAPDAAAALDASDASATETAAAAAAAPVQTTFTVVSSDVIVTGGLGYAQDRYRNPTDPAPRDKVDIVRVYCTARGKPEEEKKYSCAPATAPTSSSGNAFDRRAAECFDVKTRPATPAEAAKVTQSLQASKDVDVPRGRIFAVEIRYLQQKPEMRGVPCTGTSRQPCDPTTMATGKMIDASETQASAIGPGRTDASSPYWTWALNRIEMSPKPTSIDGQPRVVRVAVLFNQAVEAARSGDRTRIAAAVKELEAEVDGFRDRSLQPISDAVSRDLPTLHALVTGRATVGDACKR